MTDAGRSLRFPALERAPVAALFAAGLALRLAGLLFNGMADIYQILLDWGFSVWKHGLVATFGINYGALSYAAFGLVVRGAEAEPRFWWATYKLLIIAVDVGLLAALMQLVRPEQRKAVLILYWLNPWFIVHEPFHGFWESPHIVLGVLSVLAVARTSGSPAGWGTAGVLLAASAMLKPQGLLYFIVPTGIYLAAQWLRGYRAALHWWLAGVAAVVGATSLYFWAAGGSALAVVDNYRSAFTSMSGLSNGGPGIWRFVSYAYGLATGQHGHVAFIRMPRLLIGAGSAVAALSCFGLFAFFALRVAPSGVRDISFVDTLVRRLGVRYPFTPRAPGDVLWLLLILGSLVMSQFGVRAHINHSYTALILLVPLVVARPALFRPWAALTTLLAVAHLLIFALGGPVLLPPESILHTYPSAQELIASVRALPAYNTPDGLLVFQQHIWDAIHWMPVESIVSWLSPLVFAVACWLVVALFQETGRVPPAPAPRT